MMANINSFYRFRRALVASTALVAIGATGAAHALTAAGELIQSQASATFNDSIGNPYSAQSNIATVEVKQVYFATLGSDGSKSAISNSSVNIPHLLSNTGNGEDTYTVSVANNNTNPDSGDFDSLRVYLDDNQNGVVDAGEIEVSSLTLAAGESASLIVFGALPTALAGDTFASTLSVTSAQPGTTVTDVSASKGLDGLDGTNEDVVTITDDAVVDLVATSLLDATNNTITYTVTATNNGNEPATDLIIFAGLPEGTTLVSQSQSGIDSAINASDVAATPASLLESALSLDFNGNGTQLDDTETQLGLDLDGDGTLSSGSVDGVYTVDGSLSPSVTVEMTFVVSFDPAILGAGDVIQHNFFAASNLDGDNASADGFVTSNTLVDTVPSSYGVTVTDTNQGALAGTNDGGDDDSLANKEQYVDAVQSGETVIFNFDVTNSGNGSDVFELSTSGSTFPAGTNITFWNEAGTNQLLNTNGFGGVDTSTIAQSGTIRIQVRAQLPAGVTQPGVASEFVFEAFSASDGATPPVSDTSKAILGSIEAPTVDLSTLAADGDPSANADAYGNDGAAVSVKAAAPGETVVFDIFVQNDSTVSDSFQLSAGGSYIANTLGSMPGGWSVVFKDSGGNIVTSTPSLPQGGVFTGTAEVTISSTSVNALADRASFDFDGVNSSLDANSDGDQDYAIFFYTLSTNSGVSDYLLNAVDVNEVETLSLQQNSSGQVQPGGSLDFPHTVRNEGNTTEKVKVFVTSGTPGWSFNVLVDADGDGAAETPYAALTPGSSTIYYRDENAVLTAGTLDANGELELEPNDSLEFIVRSFAPTNAPNGQLNVLNISVLYNSGTSSVENTDSVEVNNAQLRLVKTAAIDEGCLGAASSNLGPDMAFTETLSRAEPGDCVIWQVVGTNAGATHITDVVINDSVPAFSMFESGTLRICKADAGAAQTEDASCVFTSLTDTVGDDEGEFNLGTITFKGGQGGSATIPMGQLESGESVTVRFATQVE